MLFVWSIDFFLFCIVVFVGFVICFLVSWYTSFLFCMSLFLVFLVFMGLVVWVFLWRLIRYVLLALG